jgi:putative sterol carrier protein
MPSQLETTLEGLKKRFRPGAVDKTITYYLSLGEGPGDKWTVKIGPSAVELAPGKPDNADCVLKTSAALFQRMVTGDWRPGVMDFMTGKIKTSDIERLKLLQAAFGL